MNPFKTNYCKKCHDPLTPVFNSHVIEEVFKGGVEIFAYIVIGVVLVLYFITDLIIIAVVFIVMVIASLIAIKYLTKYSCVPCDLEYEIKQKELILLNKNNMDDK